MDPLGTVVPVASVEKAAGLQHTTYMATEGTIAEARRWGWFIFWAGLASNYV